MKKKQAGLGVMIYIYLFLSTDDVFEFLVFPSQPYVVVHDNIDVYVENQAYIPCIFNEMIILLIYQRSGVFYVFVDHFPVLATHISLYRSIVRRS